LLRDYNKTRFVVSIPDQQITTYLHEVCHWLVLQKSSSAITFQMDAHCLQLTQTKLPLATDHGTFDAGMILKFVVGLQTSVYVFYTTRAFVPQFGYFHFSPILKNKLGNHI